MLASVLRQTASMSARHSLFFESSLARVASALLSCASEILLPAVLEGDGNGNRWHGTRMLLSAFECATQLIHHLPTHGR